MQEAMFFEKHSGLALKCTLCPHGCLLPEGKTGICGVRKNAGGKGISLVYGKIIAAAIDPIEKKPLFHVLPGSAIYSFATVGCNLRCLFCQNWDISQMPKGQNGKISGEEYTPRQVVDSAIRLGCTSIAMTYNEPGIQYEFAYDVCRLAKEKGLITVFVSNGYLNKEPIDKLSRYLDAINIDLKSFSDETYKKICGARLEPVLDAIKQYRHSNVWVELTTLIIPGVNDSVEELEQISQFIVSVDKNIPWHVTAFHPDYKMQDKSPTPAKTLRKAYEIGKKHGLSFVYAGNMSSSDMENTCCPGCGKTLIERRGYHILHSHISQGKCAYCHMTMPGIF